MPRAPAGHTERMPRIMADSLDEHHELVWNNLAQAVADLLADHSYESISLAQIADRAGVARNTLYRYAPDKTALMFRIAQRVSGPVLERVQEISTEQSDPATRVDLMISELLHAFTDRRIRLILQPTAMSIVPYDVMRRDDTPFGIVAGAMEHVLREGLQSGAFRVVGDVETTAWLLGGIVRSAAERIVSDGMPVAELLPTVSALVLGALSQAPGTPARVG